MPPKYAGIPLDQKSSAVIRIMVEKYYWSHTVSGCAIVPFTCSMVIGRKVRIRIASRNCQRIQIETRNNVSCFDALKLRYCGLRLRRCFTHGKYAEIFFFSCCFCFCCFCFLQVMSGTDIWKACGCVLWWFLFFQWVLFIECLSISLVRVYPFFTVLV